MNPKQFCKIYIFRRALISLAVGVSTVCPAHAVAAAVAQSPDYRILMSDPAGRVFIKNGMTGRCITLGGAYFPIYDVIELNGSKQQNGNVYSVAEDSCDGRSAQSWVRESNGYVRSAEKAKYCLVRYRIADTSEQRLGATDSENCAKIKEANGGGVQAVGYDRDDAAAESGYVGIPVFNGVGLKESKIQSGPVWFFPYHNGDGQHFEFQPEFTDR